MSKITKDDVDDVVNGQQLTVHSNNKTYKKLSLGLNKAFSDYLKLKLNNNEEAINVNEEYEFENIVNLGLIQAKTNLFSKHSILLHKGKKPRSDVWDRLGRIAKAFLDCKTYPKIPSYGLAQLLNKALGDRDYRVIQDYRKTVLSYCNFDEQIINRCNDSRLGEIDVAFFVSQIPKQYLTTSSTSSFAPEEDDIII